VAGPLRKSEDPAGAPKIHMNDPQDFPRIAVVGAGAVGGYFGGVLAGGGAPVVMIGRKPFVDAVNANGLVIDGAAGQTRIEVEATTDVGAVTGASVVLLCVKSNDTVIAAKQMVPFVRPDALVVCLQNGVDNVERIGGATKIEALPAAVYVAVSMPEPGHIKHLARGDVILGPESERTIRAREIFGRAQIPCRITSNIEGEMWIKLLCNCALNAISALGHARYGQIARSGDARRLMQRVVDEVLAVAHAAGVTLPNIKDSKEGMAAAMEIATQMAGAFSSTAQDIQSGKMTEIDSLNGYIARRGAELGIDVPVNHALFTLVKLLEDSFSV
jgi:2-dehydropantoate 2-reductase